MRFKLQALCMLFPGAVLIVVAGTLMDSLPTFGLVIDVLGFLLLVAWPVFTIIVRLRHRHRLKRLEQQGGRGPGSTVPGMEFEERGPRDRAYAFVLSVEKLIVTVGMPVAVLGGLGVYCFVTVGSDSRQQEFKIFAGIGSLGLLGAYLLLIARGRTALTLRTIGLAVAVFGAAGSFAVASTMLGSDVVSGGDVVMAIASIVMIAAGLWLAITGRNTFRREPVL